MLLKPRSCPAAGARHRGRRDPGQAGRRRPSGARSRRTSAAARAGRRTRSRSGSRCARRPAGRPRSRRRRRRCARRPPRPGAGARGWSRSAFVERAEDLRVALRPDDDHHRLVVLGRRADHRRPADVDLLDRLFEGDLGPASPSRRRDRGCSRRGRSVCRPCSASASMCSGLSRRARMPACTPGWRVLMRPSIISGKPVRSLTGWASTRGVLERPAACCRSRRARSRAAAGRARRRRGPSCR